MPSPPLGSLEPQTAALEEAAAAARQALMEYTRKHTAALWAHAQADLGSALLRIGEHREQGAVSLRAATAAYREALLVYTREQDPVDWSVTLVDLGLALTLLGERGRDVAFLRKAIRSYTLAFEVQPREAASQQVQAIRENLALTQGDLVRLGAMHPGG